MKNTYLINIEGLDGAGKSSVILELKRILSAHEEIYAPINTTHFPQYNTDTGKVIDKWLHNELLPNQNIDELTKGMMYALDRRIWYLNNESLLTTPGIILSDRSYMSDIFISNYGFPNHMITNKNGYESRHILQKKLLMKYNLEIENTVLQSSHNITVINLALDVMPKTAMSNMKTMGKSLDLIEKNNDLRETTFSNIMYIYLLIPLIEKQTPALPPLSKYFGYQLIHCYNKNGELKSVNEIACNIAEIIKNAILSE